MSSSDSSTNQINFGGQVEIFLLCAPKENHNALAKISRHTDDFYRKHGVLKYVFNLNLRENTMNSANLSKIIYANDEEDVWLEILSFRDDKHVQEVMEAMKGDKRTNELYEEAMEIITPGSIVNFKDFSKLEKMS
jgi:large subunit ribosomal protein L17